jgi:nucleotide-binding universal stress UspA family protein
MIYSLNTYKRKVSMMKKILIPVDSSDFSEMAVEEGVKMVNAFGCKVVLLYVVHITEINPRFGIQLSHVEKEDTDIFNEEKGAREMLDKYKELFGDRKDKVETILVHGHVVDEIMKAINDNDTDFVIMGSHGIGSALYRTILGSVANKIVHHSTKPVLVVK